MLGSRIFEGYSKGTLISWEDYMKFPDFFMKRHHRACIQSEFDLESWVYHPELHKEFEERYQRAENVLSQSNGSNISVITKNAPADKYVKACIQTDALNKNLVHFFEINMKRDSHSITEECGRRFSGRTCSEEECTRCYFIPKFMVKFEE